MGKMSAWPRLHLWYTGINSAEDVFVLRCSGTTEVAREPLVCLLQGGNSCIILLFQAETPMRILEERCWWWCKTLRGELTFDRLNHAFVWSVLFRCKRLTIPGFLGLKSALMHERLEHSLSRGTVTLLLPVRYSQSHFSRKDAEDKKKNEIKLLMLPSRCSNNLLCRKCLPWCWTATTTYKNANLVCALNPIIRANESDRTSFYLLSGEMNAWLWSHFFKTQIQRRRGYVFFLDVKRWQNLFAAIPRLFFINSGKNIEV